MAQDLKVIAKAKDLATLIFEITEKSPKKFRFTLVSRMQNLSLDVISRLYAANDTFVATKADAARRLSHSGAALTSLRELDFLTVLSAKMQAITPKQQERIAALLYETRALTAGFIKSDRQRYGGK